MSSLVVVAIPREDDPVWKISSEKVPHLTILFLGENGDHPDKGRIFEFLEHAANTTLTRFGLDAERRGTLGDDEADVVFFRKDNWSFPKIEAFRSDLLQDHAIRKAFDSVPQFPEWTPHLTLGYPKTPAKKSTDERLYYVQFDRIALWDGDFEGTELLLKDEYSMEVSMSDTVATGEKFLSHFGVKGMRWGVRRSGINIGKVYFEKNDGTKRTTKTGRITTATPKRKPPTSDDFKKATAAKAKIGTTKVGKTAKKTAPLSNDELQSLVKRMNLEKQYAELSTRDQRKVVGAKFVGDVMVGVAKGQATRLGNQLAQEQLEKLLKKK